MKPKSAQPKETPIRLRMAELIRADGRTQYAIAKAAGMTPARLGDILHGRRALLSGRTIAQLARALGLTAYSLGKLLYECLDAENESEKA